MKGDIAVGVDSSEVAGTPPTVGVGSEAVRRSDSQFTYAVAIGMFNPQLRALHHPSDGSQKLKPPTHGQEMILVGETRDRAHFGLPEDLDELGVG